MFELQQMKEFNRRLKKILYRLFFRDEFPPYSIWEFCPMNRWNQVVEFLKYYSLCRTEWFPYIYWAVVLSSCLGFVCSLREFHMVWITPCHKLKMWRNRHFYILSHRRLRQARLGGSIISLVSWILLLFGIAKSSPFFMWPRIIVTGIVMFTEFLIWSFEVITGRVLIDIQTLISLTLPAFHFGMVRCLQNVFEEDERERCFWNRISIHYD